MIVTGSIKLEINVSRLQIVDDRARRGLGHVAPSGYRGGEQGELPRRPSL